MAHTHAFIASPAIATSKALAGSQPVYRRSGRVWLDESAARRWLNEQGWVTASGEPAELYMVEMASGFAESTTLGADGVPRLTSPARVRPCSDSERWRMLSDPAVVQAAQEAAQSAGKPYADGRLMAVGLLAKLRPASPADLARAIQLAQVAGLRLDDTG